MAGFEKPDKSNSGGFEFSDEETAYLNALSLELDRFIDEEETGGDPFPKLFNRLMELGIDHRQEHLFSIPKDEDWDRLYAKPVKLHHRYKKTGKSESYTGLRLIICQANPDESGDIVIKTSDYLISSKYGSIACQRAQVNKSDVYRREGNDLNPEEGILIENKRGSVRLVRGEDYDEARKKLRLKSKNIKAARQLIDQLKPFNQAMRDELDDQQD